MRLIDADALMEYIENEFDGVCVYDVSGNEAAREFCDMVDIAPTIDTIPVEWLRKWPKSLREGAYVHDILRDWQQEQEVR